MLQRRGWFDYAARREEGEQTRSPELVYGIQDQRGNQHKQTKKNGVTSADKNVGSFAGSDKPGYCISCRLHTRNADSKYS